MKDQEVAVNDIFPQKGTKIPKGKGRVVDTTVL